MRLLPSRPTAAAPRKPLPFPIFRKLLFLVLVSGLFAEGTVIANTARAYIRTTPVYDPPVLAGQLAPQHCSGGFYARHGQDIVLTTSAHCGTEGQVVTLPDGSRFGVLGPTAKYTPCAPGRKCEGTDINYITVEPAKLPWGHLNEVDFGAGGYRIIAPGTKPLACEDIKVGDKVEINGNLRFRDGKVLEKDVYDFPTDVYFPCMVFTSIQAQIGDSGGAVLVNGQPAGITARRVGDYGYLGFTPLPLGLEELGLELCTTPDCGLTPPAK